jgi:NAD(P)-dependent dehydrogenase (short-subunit alcohol dehydrogenase family)
VTDEASIIAAYDAAEAHFGTVHSIVANAGVAADQLSANISVDDWDHVFAVNIRGAFLTVREGGKRLIAAGSAAKEDGRIVVIGSVAAERLYLGTAANSASKAGVRHMARSLAKECTLAARTMSWSASIVSSTGVTVQEGGGTSRNRIWINRCLAA